LFWQTVQVNMYDPQKGEGLLSMSRLPIVGSDDDSWGDLLNDFLHVEHNKNGTLKLREENWVQTINGKSGPDITIGIGDIGALDKATADSNYLALGAVGQSNGIAGLDSGAHIPAAAMRPFNDRGVVAANTAYNPWDAVTYNGRRILITSAVSTGVGSTFISVTKYMSLSGIHKIYAYDYGYRADGSQATAAANKTALQNAINEAFNAGGGCVLLPFGIGYINGTIELKDRVWLEGPGMFGTTISLADNSNCHVIKNHISTNGTTDKNAQFCGVLNLNIDGRKQAQSAGNWYGIYFDTNPFNTVGADSYFDPTHLIQSVRVSNTKSDGIYLNGRSDSRVVNTKVSFAGGNAFRSSFDTHFTGCIAEKPVKAGFYIQNSSSQFNNCKAYTCGLGDTDQAGGGQDKSLGHGFVVNGAITEIVFSGCDSQQNTGHGVLVTGGAKGIMWQGTIGEPSFQNGSSYSAICLDNASYCIIDGSSWTGANPTTGLLLANGSDKNIIHMTHAGTSAGTFLAAGSVLLGNNIVANGASINPLLESAANKGVANGYASLGSDGLVPVSQLPPGSGGAIANFGLGFFGDGSDGDVTLDGAATFPWGTLIGGNTYRLGRNVNFNSLAINGGITVESRGFVVNVKTAVSGSGAITANGSAATSASGAAGAFSGAIAGGKNGGAGGAAVAGAIGVANSGECFGGAGGNGGSGSSTAGGVGGTISAPANSNGGLLMIRSLPGSCVGHHIANNGIRQFVGGGGGAGGGGDGVNAGGGGGGSGGALIVNAKTVSGISLTFSANGGNGFSPAAGNTGGGGGGGGGLVIVNTTIAPVGLTVQANGGAGGTAHGTGVSGAVGAAGTTVTNIFS
jgi:hypothetical protein